MWRWSGVGLKSGVEFEKSATKKVPIYTTVYRSASPCAAPYYYRLGPQLCISNFVLDCRQCTITTEIHIRYLVDSLSMVNVFV